MLIMCWIASGDGTQGCLLPSQRRLSVYLVADFDNERFPGATENVRSVFIEDVNAVPLYK